MKKLTFLGLIALCISSPLSVLSSSGSTVLSKHAVINEAGITSRKDVIEWRYKIMNGKYYKRLYNYTKEKWVGDWIPF